MGNCFVRSISMISSQSHTEDWFNNPVIHKENYVRATEPEVKDILPSSEARRMCKLMKRAMFTSLSVLSSSGIKKPDAIITGTGAGCMENSEKFLIDMSRYGENCLKPTLFMQSTHNTISSQIAIFLGCNGYNNTYSHKGISFESALLDAFLLLFQGAVKNVLIGSHDEVTEIMSKFMHLTHPEYKFVSEISMSALLQDSRTVESICEVSDVRLLYRPEIEELSESLQIGDDTVVVMGVNGNSANDQQYLDLKRKMPENIRIVKYKDILGDNYSASAAAFYLACKIFETNGIPAHFRYNDYRGNEGDINKVVIINNSDNTSWTIIKMER